MGMKRLLIALVWVMALLLAACTRQASPSNPEAGSQAEGEGSELPFPTSEFNPMDILETAAAATLTAQVEPGEVEPVVEPTATQPPVVEEVPAATATPMAEPTQVPEPTEEPSPETPAQPETATCSSPHRFRRRVGVEHCSEMRPGPG